MSDLDHVDNYPEIPVSLAPTSTVLKTGAWRSVRPVLKTRTAPCNAYCPAGISIPEYFDYLTQDKVEDAHSVFMERNPFPRITGRVCPRFCEHGCNLAVATACAQCQRCIRRRAVCDSKTGCQQQGRGSNQCLSSFVQGCRPVAAG